MPIPDGLDIDLRPVTGYSTPRGLDPREESHRSPRSYALASLPQVLSGSVQTSGSVPPSALPGHAPPATLLASFPMGQIEREECLILTEDKNQV